MRRAPCASGAIDWEARILILMRSETLLFSIPVSTGEPVPAPAAVPNMVTASRIGLQAPGRFQSTLHERQQAFKLRTAWLARKWCSSQAFNALEAARLRGAAHRFNQRWIRGIRKRFVLNSVPAGPFGDGDGPSRSFCSQLPVFGRTQPICPPLTPQNTDEPSIATGNCQSPLLHPKVRDQLDMIIDPPKEQFV